MINIQEFQAAISPLYCTVSKCILHRPAISRSCHVQHSTGIHNAAGHSIFNIQEFQAAFSPLYCTITKCILHGEGAYSVHTVCSCIAQNVR